MSVNKESNTLVLQDQIINHLYFWHLMGKWLMPRNMKPYQATLGIWRVRLLWKMRDFLRFVILSVILFYSDHCFIIALHRVSKNEGKKSGLGQNWNSTNLACPNQRPDFLPPSSRILCIFHYFENYRRVILFVSSLLMRCSD